MLAGAPKYSVAIKHPVAGLVPATSLFGAQVTGCEHEHGLPGGPVGGRFTVHGKVVPPIGAQVTHFSGGVPVFSGSIGDYQQIGRGRSAKTQVEVRGAVRHAQEDATFNKRYVHQNLGSWVSCHNVPGQDLTIWKPFGGKPNIHRDGTILLDIPNDTRVPTNMNMGVVLDLGPSDLAKTVYVSWTGSGGDGAANLYVSNDANGIGTADESVLLTTLTGATALSGSATTTFTTARRYVLIFISRAVAVAYASDVWVSINAAIVTTAAGYQSAGASVLKGSTVFTDVVGSGALPQISTDASQIQALPTSLAAFGTGGPEAPYDTFERANSADLYQWYFDQSPLPVTVLRPTPTGVHWVAAPGTYRLPDDGSGFSIADLYNRATVKWVDGAGTQHQDVFTSTSPLLTQAGLTREATIELQRVTTSTEVAALAASFLAAYVNPPMRGGAVTITGGYVLGRDSGVQWPCSRLFIGDRIELPAARDPLTGLPGYRGIIQNVKWVQDTGTCELVLESDRMAWDRMLQRFEAGVPWGRGFGWA